MDGFSIVYSRWMRGVSVEGYVALARTLGSLEQTKNLWAGRMISLIWDSEPGLLHLSFNPKSTEAERRSSSFSLLA